MKYFLTYFLVCAFLAPALASEPHRIVVLDSGFNVTPEDVPLCPTGHADFTGTGMRDTVPHGTNVAALIAQQVRGLQACIIVVKVLKNHDGNAHRPYLDGLKHALRTGAKTWNMSLVGGAAIPEETRLLSQALDQGVTIFVAAGNGEAVRSGYSVVVKPINLDQRCEAFPACADPRLRVVSAYDLTRANFGKIVDIWESGLRKVGGGLSLSGTSQATAIATGKYVRNLLKNREP